MFFVLLNSNFSHCAQCDPSLGPGPCCSEDGHCGNTAGHCGAGGKDFRKEDFECHKNLQEVGNVVPTSEFHRAKQADAKRDWGRCRFNIPSTEDGNTLGTQRSCNFCERLCPSPPCGTITNCIERPCGKVGHAAACPALWSEWGPCRTVARRDTRQLSDHPGVLLTLPTPVTLPEEGWVTEGSYKSGLLPPNWAYHRGQRGRCDTMCGTGCTMEECVLACTHFNATTRECSRLIDDTLPVPPCRAGQPLPDPATARFQRCAAPKSLGWWQQGSLRGPGELWDRTRFMRCYKNFNKC